MDLHKYEHDALTKYRQIQDDEIIKLRKYCSYISKRIEWHALKINEKYPVIAAALLDELDDAKQVSGLNTDPREM